MKRYFYLFFGALMLIFAGFVYAWSVLATPLAAEFNSWSAAKLALTFTICMIAFCVSGFLAGIYAKKFSLRLIILATAALYLLGFYLVYKTQNSISNIYLGFGLIGGCATGIIYNVIVSTVVSWFPDKTGLASGVLLMGFGFGSFLIGKVYKAVLLAELLHWREFFLAAAIAIFLVFLLGAFLLKRPCAANLVHAVHMAEKAEHSFTCKQMLTTKAFKLYFIWTICLGFSVFALIANANGFLMETSPLLAETTAATIIGLISIANGGGRVLFGLMYDKLGYKRTMIVVEANFLFCILMLLTALITNNVILMTAGFVCGGLTLAGGATMNSTFANDFFGKKHYAINYAVINLSVLVSSLGGTVAGKIYDNWESYFYVVVLFAATFFVSIICAKFIKKPLKLG